MGQHERQSNKTPAEKEEMERKMKALGKQLEALYDPRLGYVPLPEEMAFMKEAQEHFRKSTTFCLGVSFGLTMATRFLPRPPGLILSSLLFTTLSVGLTTSNGVRVLAKEMNKGLVMDESPVAHSFRVLIKSLDVPEAVGKLSPEAQAKIRAAEVHMRPDGLPDLTPPDRLLARMTYRQDATGMMDAVDTEAERKLARHAAGMRDADPALVRDEAMPRDEPMPADEAMPTFVDRPASSGKGVRRNKYGDIVEDD